MTKAPAKPAGRKPLAHPVASSPIGKVNETELNAATTWKLCSRLLGAAAALIQAQASIQVVR